MSGARGSVATGPLVLDRVAVGDASIEALIHVRDARLTRTSAVPGLAKAALGLLPGLRRHRCDCGSSHGIASEMADTEVPHLLEHVALELMALSGSSRRLRGETTWDFAADGPGVFRVRIEYDDDLVALGALERGLHIVNTLLTLDAGRSSPSAADRLGRAGVDPERYADQLRALRSR